MYCSLVLAAVQKVHLEDPVRHNKGWIVGSHGQVIFRNTGSLSPAFPDAAGPFIFLTSLWTASTLQIEVVSHPLIGRETRGRNVFLLSS